MQIGFYFNQSRCTGCHTCAIACVDYHNLDVGTNLRRVTTEETGKFPKPSASHLSLSCNHCANPTCALVCPVSAIAKRKEDGIVVANQEKCLGKDSCGMLCKKACPYSSPQFAANKNTKMQKCDLCLDRWKEGRKPVCVEACPMRALDAGPLNLLRNKYRNIKKAVGYIYYKEIGPSIIFDQSPKTNKGVIALPDGRAIVKAA